MGILFGLTAVPFFIFLIASLASSSLISRISLNSLCCTSLWILSFSTFNNSSKYSFHRTSPSLFLMHLICDTSSDLFFLHVAILLAVFTPPCSSKLLRISICILPLLLLSLPVYWLVCTLSCFLRFPIYISSLFFYFFHISSFWPST